MAVHGPRVVPVGRGAVHEVALSLDERRVHARRTARGWDVDDRPATGGTAAALEDLLDSVTRLRAIDAFRARDASSYGLERPRGAIEVLTARGRRCVLVLGGLNSAGTALYARRIGDPRILLIGTGLLTELERVFYAPAVATQRPEIG